MSKKKRVWNIIVAIFMIQSALFLMIIPEIAFMIIAMFVGMMLTFRGIKFLFYYSTHACHMIGGKKILLVGLLMFDVGIFSISLIDQAQMIMIFYVVAIHLVAAVLNFARAVSNRCDGNPGWKIDLAQGIGNVAQVVLCLIFAGFVEIPVFIYCAGVIYSAILKIISSCKKTAIVYVQ